MGGGTMAAHDKHNTEEVTMRAVPTTILSHWDYRIEDMDQSAMTFYAEIERRLALHQVDQLKTERINISEGGVFSAKREYLQVRRGEHVFHICAAPFGNGFFVSWWLGHVESGFWALLAGIPVIGFLVRNFLKPITYFKVDTALMFQSVTHAVVTEALNAMLDGKGRQSLSDVERKPLMRDFFAQLGG